MRTYHDHGAKDIPTTSRHALLSMAARWELMLSPKNPKRQARTAWCDATHLALLLQHIPHVCQVRESTEEIVQIWVMEPTALNAAAPPA